MDRRHVFGAVAGFGAALIVGGVALAAATQSGGDHPLHGPGAGGGPGMLMPGLVPHALLGRMAGELGLSPEQRQMIQAYFDQARPGFEQLRRQMFAGTELLTRTAPDDAAYPSVVANVSRSAADLAAQFVLQASELRSQVHGVLTPAQRIKLAALEADLHARMREHRHPAPPAADGAPQGPR